jgi:WD40 repeat protein
VVLPATPTEVCPQERTADPAAAEDPSAPLEARRTGPTQEEDFAMSLTLDSKPRANRHAGHSHVVTSVAFSPDGRTLASGGWDGTVKLWDIRHGALKLRRTLRADWDEVDAVAFAPDGGGVAGLGTGFDRAPYGLVMLWAPGASRGRALVRAEGKIDAIAFAPGGGTLATACGDRRVVTLREVATGEVRSTLSGHRRPIRSVAYAPDGRTLAVASGDVPALARPDGREPAGEVCLWDLAGQEPRTRARVAGHEHGALSVAFSPDGTTLATGGFDRRVKLWGVEVGLAWATLTAHEGWVAALAFAPDGATLATGSHDQTIRLWDMATGRESATLTGHTGNVYSVAFSPDGSLLASGSHDGTVRLWDVALVLSQGARPSRPPDGAMGGVLTTEGGDL